MSGRSWRKISVQVAPGLAVLAILSGLVLAAGSGPLAAGSAALQGAFGDRFSIAETLLAAMPLALLALGVAPALHAGLVPVGAEGQLIAGAACATAMLLAFGPHATPLLFCIGALSGMLGGTAYALVPAVLRAWFRVGEILSTLLMNYLAGFALLWLLRGPMHGVSHSATAHSDALPASAMLANLLPHTRLHWGIMLVPPAGLLLAWWRQSASGLRYGLFATKPALAARLGLSESRAVMTTMLLSGGAAGLVGWLQVAGLTGTLYPGVGHGLGFTGILVALLGGLRPIGILLAALVLGALTTGADGLQSGTGIPASIATLSQGLLLLAAVLRAGGRVRQAA